MGGTGVLSFSDLVNESRGCCFLVLLSLSEPFDGTRCLNSLWLGNMVDVFLNGILGLLIEVFWLLWSLGVFAWFVTLVSVSTLEEGLELGDFSINGFTNSSSALEKALVKGGSHISDRGFEIS